jgi:hypothetical protein
MMGLRKHIDAIKIKEKRFGYFPQRFLWRGRDYLVHRVESCWTVKRGGLFGRVERLCFRVHCREGVFDVYQDVRGNTWHIQKPRLI